MREHVTWRDPEFETPWSDHQFFEGEVEPCINGNTVATGAYFGVDMTPLVERLLGEQLSDGGWNCEVENGAIVSSMETTMSVLEGLLEYERTKGGSAGVGEARRRGEAYMLERRLYVRKSTGEVIDPEWLLFSFPHWYHYDILQALLPARCEARPTDERIADAIASRGGQAGSRRAAGPCRTSEAGASPHRDGRPARASPAAGIRCVPMRVLDWYEKGR